MNFPDDRDMYLFLYAILLILTWMCRGFWDEWMQDRRDARAVKAVTEPIDDRQRQVEREKARIVVYARERIAKTRIYPYQLPDFILARRNDKRRGLP